jgi:2-oxoglutarate dehydrogenase E1 component
VIIDSFIVSGEAKWGQTSRLTLLLPHGYEGSGPEHSSARIERFMALGAEGNIRIANPTTAAQYFHLLRRQALIRKPRPLIVFTPKGCCDSTAPVGLEERPRASSTILDDPKAASAASRSSGSCSAPARSTTTSTPASAAGAENGDRPRRGALPVRPEQLESVIAGYPNLKEIAPEEPRNMGACCDVPPHAVVLPEGVISPTSAAPASQPGEGYSAPTREQERIVLTALTPGAEMARSGPLFRWVKASPGSSWGSSGLIASGWPRLRHRDDGVRLGARARIRRLAW